MVDEINLFEDDEGQTAKHGKSGDSPSRKDGDLAGDSLKSDDFSFDDELTEPSLDQFDSEIEPEFTDDKSPAEKSRRSKGRGNAQKSSPTILVIGGLIVAAFLVYQFILKPSTAKPRKPAQTRVRTVPIAPGTPADTTRRPAPQATAIAPGAGSAAGTTVKYVESVKTIVENLGKDGQFVTVILDGDQYFVQYASAGRGVSDAMGKRIQGLLGADAYKASPEDRHKIAGSDWYCGVISGRLAIAKSLAPAAGAKTDAEAFKSRLSGLAGEKGLTNLKIQKVRETTLNGKLQTPIRLRAEGPRPAAMAFLDGLKSLPANGRMSKLLVAPLDITDLHAEKIKLVVDFSVE
jgi:hypothetical protein